MLPEFSFLEWIVRRYVLLKVEYCEIYDDEVHDDEIHELEIRQSECMLLRLFSKKFKMVIWQIIMNCSQK